MSEAPLLHSAGFFFFFCIFSSLNVTSFMHCGEASSVPSCITCPGFLFFQPLRADSGPESVTLEPLSVCPSGTSTRPCTLLMRQWQVTASYRLQRTACTVYSESAECETSYTSKSLIPFFCSFSISLRSVP